MCKLRECRDPGGNSPNRRKGGADPRQAKKQHPTSNLTQCQRNVNQSLKLKASSHIRQFGVFSIIHGPWKGPSKDKSSTPKDKDKMAVFHQQPEVKSFITYSTIWSFFHHPDIKIHETAAPKAPKDKDETAVFHQQPEVKSFITYSTIWSFFHHPDIKIHETAAPKAPKDKDETAVFHQQPEVKSFITYLTIWSFLHHPDIKIHETATPKAPKDKDKTAAPKAPKQPRITP